MQSDPPHVVTTKSDDGVVKSAVCSCKAFELEQRVCSHAAAVMAKLEQDPHTLTPPFTRNLAMLDLYGVIPEPGLEEINIADLPHDGTRPPNYAVRPKGRPRKQSRKKSRGEGRQLQCRRCGGFGHRMLGKQGQVLCKNTVPTEWADVLFDRVLQASDVVQDGEFSEDEVLPCSRIGGDVEKPSADASSSSKRKVEEQGSRHEICRTVEDMNDQLIQLGGKLVKIRGDGNCFYHALGETLGRGKNKGMEIKKELVVWLNGRRRVPFIHTIDFAVYQEKVAKELGENGFYAEETHIKCAVECYKIRLCILTNTLSNNEGCCSYTPHLGDIRGTGKVFHRGNTGAGDHYDVLEFSIDEDEKSFVTKCAAVDMVKESNNMAESQAKRQKLDMEMSG